MMLEDLKKELLAMILDGDRQGATSLMATWADSNGYERAVTELLEPVLSLIGKRWESSETISLGQGYVAGKVAEDIMEMAAFAHAVDSREIESKGTVVIGNIEEDSHALGRKLVIIFLKLDGWKIVDLGVDVPAVEFVDKAVEVGDCVIAASAMMYRTAMNIKGIRQELDKRGLSGSIPLAVGGAVFVQRPELVQEVGGDGTAPNAISAAALMERLQDASLSRRDKP
jgi:methanogenic corrinoid protein MtbC1